MLFLFFCITLVSYSFAENSVENNSNLILNNDLSENVTFNGYNNNGSNYSVNYNNSSYIDVSNNSDINSSIIYYNETNVSVNVSVNNNLSYTGVNISINITPSVNLENVSLDSGLFEKLKSFFQDIIIRPVEPVLERFMNIAARLVYENSTPIADQKIIFKDITEDVILGENITDDSGWGEITYKIPATFTEGTHNIEVFFPRSDNFTSAVASKVVVFSVNNTNIINVTNVTIDVEEIIVKIVQMDAVVGMPVRWVKQVRVKNNNAQNQFVNVSISAPVESKIISVDEKKNTKNKKIDSYLVQTTSIPVKKGMGVSSALVLNEEDLERSFEQYREVKFNDTISGESQKEYIITYETIAPVKEEKKVQSLNGVVSKSVKVISNAPIHYKNIKASSELDELFTHVADDNHARVVSEYRLFWNHEGIKEDVTDKTEFNVEFTDINGTLFLTWNVPHLSTQSFEIQADYMDLQDVPSTSQKEWTVYFRAEGEGTLEVDNLDSSDISYTQIYYYSEGSGQWIAQYPTILGDKFTIFWNGTDNPRGKIIYNVSNYGKYLLNVTFENLNLQIENYNFYKQLDDGTPNMYVLDLDFPFFNFEICTFSDVLWACDPLNVYYPGYDGFTQTFYGSNNKIIKIVEIPKKSTVTNVSFVIDTKADETRVYIPYVDNVSSDGINRKLIDVGDVSDALRDDIVIGSDQKIQLLNESSSQIPVWTYDSDYVINDLDVGDIQIAVNSYEEIAFVTEFGLFVLWPNGTIANSSTGNTYSKITVGEVSSTQSEDKKDDDSVDSISCIGCSSGNYSQRFEIPWDVSGFSGTCYVKTRFNYRGSKSGNLTASLNGTEYSVDSGLISYNNILNYLQDDGTIDDLNCIGCSEGESKISFTLLDLGLSALFPADNCYVRTRLNYNNSKSGNLTFVLNGTTYDVDENQITMKANTTIYTQDDIIADGRQCVGCPGTGTNTTEAVYTIPYVFGDLSFSQCFLQTAINYKTSNSKDLQFTLNGITYDLNESKVNVNNKLLYYNGTSTATDIGCVGCNGTYQQKFNLFYPISSPIPANNCFIRTAVNYAGFKSGNLTFTLNGSVHNINESLITTTNILEYYVDDGSAEENIDCVGCGILNNTKQRFKIGSLSELQTSPKGKTCYVKYGICYNGTNIGDLGMYLYPGPNYYDINETKFTTECSSGFDWVYESVNCNDVDFGASYYLDFRCVGCNSTSNYRIVADNGTNQGLSLYDSGGGSFVSVPKNYLVRFYTNDSLDYDFVDTELPCSDVKNNRNITYSCSGCNDTEYYNLLFGSASNGNTWEYNGSVWDVKSTDVLVRAGSDESLNYNVVNTEVNCDDLGMSKNVTYYCANCDVLEPDNHYYMVLDSSIGGGSSYWKNGSAESLNSIFGQDYIVRVKTESLNSGWTTTQVGCVDVESSENITYQCLDCSGVDTYNIFSDTSTAGNTYDEAQTLISGKNVMVRLYSNTSHRSNWVRTEVGCSDLSQNYNITYNCNDCNDTDYYNIMQDSSTNGDSYSSINNGISWTQDTTRNVMTRVELFGSNVGDEIIVSETTLVRVFNPSLVELWNYDVSSTIYDIAIGDITGTSENEVLIGTIGGYYIIDSLGAHLYNDTSKFVRVIIPGMTSNGGRYVVATNDGYVTGKTSSHINAWNYYIGSSSIKVKTISVGDITFDTGNEIVVGLSNGTLVVLSSTGVPITSYVYGSDMLDSVIGDTHIYTGNEIGVVSSNNFGYVLNYNFASQNPAIDVGDDGSDEWNYTGTLREITTAYNTALKDAFNTELLSCVGPDMCNVTVAFKIPTSSEFNIQRPKITLQYNATDVVTYATENYWAKINGVVVDESVYFGALKISYTPSIMPLFVDYIGSTVLGSFSNSIFNREICNLTFANPKMAYIGYIDGQTEIKNGCGRGYYIPTIYSRADDY
ncbi:hypothetical protein GQ473_02470, partial [archaeon]|nr:hypothetical protein [archaeon]